MANLLPLLPDQHTPVAFRFTPMLGGNWSVDDVQVDPYKPQVGLLRRLAGRPAAAGPRQLRARRRRRRSSCFSTTWTMSLRISCTPLAFAWP